MLKGNEARENANWKFQASLAETDERLLTEVTADCLKMLSRIG